MLDNARIHHENFIETVLLIKNSQRLTLIFLPPYSPDLNSLECILKWLKECIISNRFHASPEEIRVSVFIIAHCPEKVKCRTTVKILNLIYILGNFATEILI
ncbi:transposase [Bacillus thuringiensis]|uniref:transposase n=1 Tax=Bacillus thuringiensis TaxID=1428 RepID=UPI003D0537BE